SGPLLHVADLPSNLQNFVIQKKSQFLTAAASADSRPRVAAEAPEFQAEASAPATHGIRSVIPLAELERRAIINALEYTKGDRAIAAHLLGIGRTTLYRKLKEYQLPV
ncbi:MAG: helix-turn-helix domain-containing protein, partial [Bryobacteraceae bacterium]